ncbi:MAG TPA: CBS and ACT domain-containing protein [Longimicrobiaceae bacterium]|nr:CBS and ACT domain-containing protein [Longimicrobiaceae bacterium]
MLVKNRMTAEPVSVTPDATLAEALRLVREHRVRHLPVVVGGAVAGIVSDRDLRTAMPSPLEPHDAARADAVHRTPVSEVMTRDVVTVGPYDTVEDAARLLCRHRIGALPVVDAHGLLLGMISETDVLTAFAEVLSAGGPSSRLEVSLPDRPGELARMLGTVAGLGLNITSLMVMPKGEGGRKTAIVHVATIDPREAIAALEGAGATVGWPSLEADLRRGMPA